MSRRRRRIETSAQPFTSVPTATFTNTVVGDLANWFATGNWTGLVGGDTFPGSSATQYDVVLAGYVECAPNANNISISVNSIKGVGGLTLNDWSEDGNPILTVLGDINISDGGVDPATVDPHSLGVLGAYAAYGNVVTLNVGGNVTVTATNTATGIALFMGNSSNNAASLPAAPGILNVTGVLTATGYTYGIIFDDTGNSVSSLFNVSITAKEIYATSTGASYLVPGGGMAVIGGSDGPGYGNADFIMADKIVCRGPLSDGVHGDQDAFANVSTNSYFCPLIIATQGVLRVTDQAQFRQDVTLRSEGPNAYISFQEWAPGDTGSSYGITMTLEGTTQIANTAKFIDAIVNNGYLYLGNNAHTNGAPNCRFVGITNNGTWDNHWGLGTYAATGTIINNGRWSEKLNFADLSNVQTVGPWKARAGGIGPYKATATALGPYPICRTQDAALRVIAVGPFALSPDGASLGPYPLNFVLPHA